MDVSSLQQQWQGHVDEFLADKGQNTQKSLEYAKAEETLRARMKKNRGVFRLKNIFNRLFKLAPLHHKQKKLAKHVRKEREHIEGDAANTYFALGEAAVRGSTREGLYENLSSIYRQIHQTRNIVLSAANQCSSASSDETFAGMDDKNTFMDVIAQSDASNAANAVEYAKEAVETLQQTVKSLPQVDGSFANEIRSLSSNAFFADMFGGFWGSFANWNAASKLDNAEYHLRNVASGLAAEMNNVSADMRQVRHNALVEASAADPAVKTLKKSIESYCAGASGL